MTPPGEERPPYDEMRAEAARRIESYRQETDKWDLTELVNGAFDDAALDSLVSTFLARRRRATRPGTEADVLSGELSAITVSEVLSWLQDKSQTGRLQIVDGDKHVEIYVRRGKVDFAAAAGIGEDLLLGRFAVEAGALTPDALTAVLDERARATTKPALFGVDLVARGLITEAQLKQAMARQISEVIYETLRWTQGQFAFRSLPAESFPALARDAALGSPSTACCSRASGASTSGASSSARSATSIWCSCPTRAASPRLRAASSRATRLRCLSSSTARRRSRTSSGHCGWGHSTCRRFCSGCCGRS